MVGEDGKANGLRARRALAASEAIRRQIVVLRRKHAFYSAKENSQSRNIHLQISPQHEMCLRNLIVIHRLADK